MAGSIQSASAIISPVGAGRQRSPGRLQGSVWSESLSRCQRFAITARILVIFAWQHTPSPKDTHKLSTGGSIPSGIRLSRSKNVHKQSKLLINKS
tara:strand:- start:231 stop:515 length:285 start_codon:yes stop_codon:yes gene_type:complete